MKKSNTMRRAAKIHNTLSKAGWTPREECNLDNLNLEGETNEGKVCVCVLDLSLKMPESIAADNLDHILLYIENKQREVKAYNEYQESKVSVPYGGEYSGPYSGYGGGYALLAIIGAALISIVMIPMFALYAITMTGIRGLAEISEWMLK